MVKSNVNRPVATGGTVAVRPLAFSLSAFLGRADGDELGAHGGLSVQLNSFRIGARDPSLEFCFTTISCQPLVHAAQNN